MRILGGILLVSGTTIGAAMLALPVASGFAGWIPSLFLLVVFWAYMALTAFLMLEVNLWMDSHTNLISMARHTLGQWGKYSSWVIYLFLLYTLTTAYMAGSGPIFAELLESSVGIRLPDWFLPFPLMIIFGFFVYKGARFVDYANRFLMLGLVVSFLLLVTFITPAVEWTHLKRSDWSAWWVPISIISTSFGFHIIIPTLTDYLNRDLNKIKKVLLIGSFLPLLVYGVWETLALGIVPLEGPSGLVAGYREGLDGASLLGEHLQNPYLAQIATIFSLFAIVTSFLGVSLSLRDFLADGLGIRKNRKGRALLYLLTFIPPLLLTALDPRAFLNALEYAGAFGVVTLLGLFPVIMVWRGRYVQNRLSDFRVPGGKWTLGFAFLFSIFIIGLEILNKTGLISFSE